MIGVKCVGLNLLQSLLLGVLSGLTEILPVSAQAHKAILLTLFGAGEEPQLLRLMIHCGVFAALYYALRPQILRMMRQRRLARVPKRRRKRPVDIRTILDYRLVMTMLVPVILGFFLYGKVSVLNSKLNWIALGLVINAIILYLPLILPSGNKDARSLTPLEGVLMGTGAAAGMVPGISSMGMLTSLGGILGADRSYVLGIALLAELGITAGNIVMDLIAIFTAGSFTVDFTAFLYCLLAAAAAFIGVYLAIKALRALAQNIGYGIFAYYSGGLALLTFILYLSAA